MSNHNVVVMPMHFCFVSVVTSSIWYDQMSRIEFAWQEEKNIYIRQCHAYFGYACNWRKEWFFFDEKKSTS